jgi:hypothetical protein
MSLDPITALLDIGGKVIERIFPDPTQAAQAKLELYKLQQSGELAQITGQMEINKTEAANASVFVSGARPFIMWICGFGLAMQFIVSPLLTWGAALLGKTIVLPPLDMGTLLTLLLGLLGLSGMRTFEKLNGVASK